MLGFIIVNTYHAVGESRRQVKHLPQNVKNGHNYYIWNHNEIRINLSTSMSGIWFNNSWNVRHLRKQKVLCSLCHWHLGECTRTSLLYYTRPLMIILHSWFCCVLGFTKVTRVLLLCDPMIGKSTLLQQDQSELGVFNHLQNRVGKGKSLNWDLLLLLLCIHDICIHLC